MAIDVELIEKTYEYPLYMTNGQEVVLFKAESVGTVIKSPNAARVAEQFDNFSMATFEPVLEKVCAENTPE